MASLTDNMLRDYEAALWLKKALVTADKKRLALQVLVFVLWFTDQFMNHCTVILHSIHESVATVANAVLVSHG